MTRSICAAAVVAAALVGLIGGTAGTALAQAKSPLAAVGGKPVAAFAIDYELVGAPAVGAPLDVRVTLRPQADVADVTLRVSSDPGLQIVSPETTLQAATATRDAPAAWTLRVVPLEDGVLRLRVYAEGMIGGSRQGRSLIVPIRVGAAKPAAPAGDDGQLIKLPASEPR